MAWTALLAAVSVLGWTLGGTFNTSFSLPGAESEAARQMLTRAGLDEGASESGQLVFAAAAGVLDDAVRADMEELFDTITAGVGGVSIAGSPYGPSGGQVSDDGTVALAFVDLGEVSRAEAIDRAAAVVELVRARPVDGVTVEFGGEPFFEEAEFSSEGIGLAAAVVILLLAFGSVLAMGLPIMTALFGVGCGVGIVTLITRFVDVPDFAVPITAMVGIGVGIDYALLIVARYRQHRATGAHPETATVAALTTAGHSVLFAGCTVVVSLTGLWMVDLAALRTAALAATIGVLLVMLASLTLLPALLGFAGDAIDRFTVPGRRAAGTTGGSPGWLRWSTFVQRRPWTSAIVGLTILLVLAAPAAGLRLGFSDAGNRLETDTSRRAYDLVSDNFGPGFNGPLFLAVDVAQIADPAAIIADLDATLSTTPGIALAVPTRLAPTGDVGVAQVFPTTSPQDTATTALVHRLRDDVLPTVTTDTGAVVAVGGVTAAAVDFSDYVSARLPLFIAAVVALSFVLLTVMFRSLLVPLKAAIMNLLSIGAAYGVLVAVFQHGWGADLLGVGEPGPIEAWAPLMLFAIVFGLSMDYEVFLLSRIREEYDRHGDNARAVADGLAMTARVITAAAAIMLFVFGAFVLSDERSLQMFGMGLAVAVLIDATVVRLLLVPATMELLGDRNWWLPGWLDRLLPHVSIDDAEPSDTRELAGAGQ